MAFNRITTIFAVVAIAFSGCVAQARLISRFGNCPELNNYYINRVIPLVGPYGVTSYNAYTNTRAPQHKPSDPGTPGGPAGLPLHRPFMNPKRIAFGNITGGAEDEVTDGSDGPIAGQDFSTTNVQVKGVDEPDIIKTDGRRIFTLSGSLFSVVQVQEGGKKGQRVGKLRLPTYPRDMLIEGDYVLVLGSDYSYRRPVYRRFKSSPSSGEESTVVYQIKISKGGWPRLISTLHLEGRYIRSREVDGVVRLVLRFRPLASIWLYYPTGGVKPYQTEKWNREIIQYSSAGNWLPTYSLRRFGRVQYGVYANCGDMYYSPDVFAGFNMLTVVTLPIAGVLSPASSASVVSDADTVYATKTSMYVTTSEYRFSNLGDNAGRWGSDYRTSIHKFALSDSGAAYVASGAVTGSVINQFAMHEYKGNFFIATTDGAAWWSSRDTSRSKVTAFSVDARARALRKIGEVGNLGIGERIFAVRFLRDMAYVVTFREIDPLYIIDLEDPKRLRVTGELKIPGFSSYLHMVQPGRIIGVGQEATLTGQTTGAKVSLFDVSDKTKPKELSSWSLRGSYTDAQWDHRAFLYWWRERIAVLPVSVYSSSESFTGAIVLDVTDSTITERGRVTHNLPNNRWWNPNILRNAIIGRKYLWSMSNELLQVNDIDKLKKVESQVQISS